MAASNPIAFIPCRAGSERFPGKHLALLGGKPLLQWTLEAAEASGVFDRIVVSSDSEAVLAEVRTYGVEIHHRLPSLATDRVTLADVLRAFLDETRFTRSLYVLLADCPLRRPDTIRAAWKSVEGTDDGLVSLVPYEAPPQWAWEVIKDKARPWHPIHWTRPRQRLRPLYRHDGGHWIVRDVRGGRVRPFFPPAEEVLDVNTPEDLAYGQFLLERRHGA